MREREAKQGREWPSLPAKMLEDILALANDGIIVVDESHRIILFNRGAEEIFGYAESEVLGEPLSLLVPVPARGGHTVQVNRFGAGAAPSRHRTHRGEIVGRRKNGEVFPVEASISKHQVAGRGVYTSILRDISVRKRQEDELRLLQTMALEIGAAESLDAARRQALQQVSQATGWATGDAWIPNEAGNRLERGSVWTGNLRELEAFHATGERFSFAPGEGLVGQVWASGRPLWVHDLQTCPDFIRKEKAGELGLRTAVVIPVLAGDEVIAVLAFYHFQERSEDQRLMDLVGAVAAQLGTLVQRKHAEAAQARQARELEEQSAELARSNAELEQFAYVASHDLQEPLRMVACYTRLLERNYGDKLDDEARAFIDFAVEGVKHMRELILDLLAYSRVGIRGEAFAPTDANRVIERTLTDLGPLLEESGAAVTYDRLPTVMVDGAQLGQIFQNLLANGLKFHRQGVPPRVHVGVREEGGECVFSVSDDGIGIDPEHQDRIFDVFQRLHSREEYPGTGVGLAICRKIVERHGGRIQVDSAPGEGTTFTFTLPAATAGWEGALSVRDRGPESSTGP